MNNNNPSDDDFGAVWDPHSKAPSNPTASSQHYADPISRHAPGGSYGDSNLRRRSSLNVQAPAFNPHSLKNRPTPGLPNHANQTKKSAQGPTKQRSKISPRQSNGVGGTVGAGGAPTAKPTTFDKYYACTLKKKASRDVAAAALGGRVRDMTYDQNDVSDATAAALGLGAPSRSNAGLVRDMLFDQPQPSTSGPVGLAKRVPARIHGTVINSIISKRDLQMRVMLGTEMNKTLPGLLENLAGEDPRDAGEYFMVLLRAPRADKTRRENVGPKKRLADLEQEAHQRVDIIKNQQAILKNLEEQIHKVKRKIVAREAVTELGFGLWDDPSQPQGYSSGAAAGPQDTTALFGGMFGGGQSQGYPTAAAAGGAGAGGANLPQYNNASFGAMFGGSQSQGYPTGARAGGGSIGGANSGAGANQYDAALFGALHGGSQSQGYPTGAGSIGGANAGAGSIGGANTGAGANQYDAALFGALLGGSQSQSYPTGAGAGGGGANPGANQHGNAASSSGMYNNAAQNWDQGL